MAEKATQNLYQNRTQTYIAFLQILSSPLSKKEMYPVMQCSVPETCCSRKENYWYSASFQTCPFPVSYGFRFQFQVNESLKDFWISYSTIERSPALKNERKPEENFENIIFARNQENRTGKNKKKLQNKKKNRGIDLSWKNHLWLLQLDTSLLCTRHIRSYYCQYCHHLQIKE